MAGRENIFSLLFLRDYIRSTLFIERKKERNATIFRWFLIPLNRFII